MMSAQFFLGASLFALLAVDVCCIPVKDRKHHDSNSRGLTIAAPSFGSNAGVPSGHYSSDVVPYDARYQPKVQPEPQPSLPLPVVYSEPAAPVGSGSSSRPVPSGHSGSAVSAVASGPGAPPQPGSQDIDWVVAPPGVFSAEGMAAGGAFVSPPLPPPGPMYQAGELNHFEESYEDGDYERETQEQGFMPPPPPPPYMASKPSFPSPPHPGPGLGHWRFYPFYDYMFLTGQYPPGTVTHASSSFEQGMDHWQDAHYVRENIPVASEPAQPEAFTSYPAAPHSVTAPQYPRKQPVKVGY